MSRISELLAIIANGVRGRDVRSAIHDAIEECYSDVHSAKTTADASVTNIATAISNANTATTAATNAATAATDAATAATGAAAAWTNAAENVVSIINTMSDYADRIEAAEDNVEEAIEDCEAATTAASAAATLATNAVTSATQAVGAANGAETIARNAAAAADTAASRANTAAAAAEAAVLQQTDSALSSSSTKPVQNKVIKAALDGKADIVANATEGNFAALDANGNLTDSGHKHSDYLTAHQDISGKADIVANATEGNFAALDANGNLTDSGHSHSDYLTKTEFASVYNPIDLQEGMSQLVGVNRDGRLYTYPSGGSNEQGGISQYNLLSGLPTLNGIPIDGDQTSSYYGIPTIQKASISLSASWNGHGPYTQTVTVIGAPVTTNSKIDLQPDETAIAHLLSAGVQALFVANTIVNGEPVLTAKAIGSAPSTTLTLQCTVTEVMEPAVETEEEE